MGLHLIGVAQTLRLVAKLLLEAREARLPVPPVGFALAPFLVMAPLIGPLVDRVRGGLPVVIVTTFVVRAVLAVSLSQHLRDLLLFPLAFGILVVAKTYTVSRNALVPSVVDDENDLVAANARLSRTSTFAGAIAAAVAVALYSATSASTVLLLGAAIYVAGAASAWWLRRVASPVAPRSNVNSANSGSVVENS